MSSWIIVSFDVSLVMMFCGTPLKIKSYKKTLQQRAKNGRITSVELLSERSGDAKDELADNFTIEEFRDNRKTIDMDI